MRDNPTSSVKIKLINIIKMWSDRVIQRKKIQHCKNRRNSLFFCEKNTIIIITKVIITTTIILITIIAMPQGINEDTFSLRTPGMAKSVHFAIDSLIACGAIYIKKD